jgi:hypothetical protein
MLHTEIGEYAEEVVKVAVGLEKFTSYPFPWWIIPIPAGQKIVVIRSIIFDNCHIAFIPV